MIRRKKAHKNHSNSHPDCSKTSCTSILFAPPWFRQNPSSPRPKDPSFVAIRDRWRAVSSLEAASLAGLDISIRWGRVKRLSTQLDPIHKDLQCFRTASICRNQRIVCVIHFIHHKICKARQKCASHPKPTSCFSQDQD